MTPHGRWQFSFVPPATPSSPSWTLEGLFELTQRSSRALDLSHAMLPELKDTASCAAVCAEVPGHWSPPRTAIANFDWVFVENTFVFATSPNIQNIENIQKLPSDLKAQSNALLNWLFSLSRWAWPWGLAELTPGKPVHAQEGTGSEKPVCKHLWKLRPEHRVRSLL